jgi:methyl-accepting chemotaxis protein
MKLKRRKYIVDKAFQWKFVLGFIVVSLIGNGVSTSLFILFARKKLEELQWSIHVTAQTTGEIIQPLFFKFNLMNFAFVLVLLLIISVWMLRKMNGPLYRITKDLKSIEEGDLSFSITLRRKDEFKYVAEALNGMLSTFRDKFTEFKNRYKDISKNLLELDISHANGANIEQMTRELIRVSEKLRDEGPFPV